MSDVAGTPLPSSGSTVQTAAGNTGDQGFIDGGGGDGWADCDGDGVSSGSSTNDSNWNAVQATTHAPTFTGSSNGINLSTWPQGNYYVYYRHSVREIRASPATATGPAYDQTTVGGWISLGTTTDPSKWGVGQTTTPDPASHWPSSTTASPCVAGNGYSGIICSCNMDMVTDFITYEGQPYNNPYKTTSFTSQQCIDPSTGNSAYKILRDGLLQLKFEPVVQVATNPLPTTGSNSQSTVPNVGWLSFIEGGGGEGWLDCNGDGVSSGSAVNDSTWNPKAPNVHAATYTERVAGPNGGFIVSPTNGCKKLSSGTFSIWKLYDGVFIGGTIPDIYEIVSIVYNGTSYAQNPFSLCPTYDRWIVNYRKTAGGPVFTGGLFHGASSGCETITWELIPGDPNAACTIPYP